MNSQKLKRMNFEDSVPIDDDPDSVHIRVTEGSFTLYAVFHDIERVSERYTMREFGHAVAFKEGYEKALNDDE